MEKGSEDFTITVDQCFAAPGRFETIALTFGDTRLYLDLNTANALGADLCDRGRLIVSSDARLPRREYHGWVPSDDV